MIVTTIGVFLQSIGFGRNESEVYETLMNSGKLSVLEISKRTKIHRSNIYDALRSLVDKGLVFEINEGKKLFSAREPESLSSFLEDKKMELENVMKASHLHGSNNNISEIVYSSRGILALREALIGLLKHNQPISVFGLPKEMSDIIGPVLDHFHRRRIEKEIVMNHIYNSDAVERVKYLNTLPYTEARVLSKKYDSYSTTVICGSHIFIAVLRPEIIIIEIQDEVIAQSAKNFFNFIWSKAKPL
jgi:sugar-specific transcriptional regulator TrmB